MPLVGNVPIGACVLYQMSGFQWIGVGQATCVCVCGRGGKGGGGHSVHFNPEFQAPRLVGVGGWVNGGQPISYGYLGA